jgi:hypothetical protein
MHVVEVVGDPVVVLLDMLRDALVMLIDGVLQGRVIRQMDADGPEDAPAPARAALVPA